MRVACFCGEEFYVDDALVHCPRCFEPACAPNVRDSDLHEMQLELELLTEFPQSAADVV